MVRGVLSVALFDHIRINSHCNFEIGHGPTNGLHPAQDCIILRSGPNLAGATIQYRYEELPVRGGGGGAAP